MFWKKRKNNLLDNSVYGRILNVVTNDGLPKDFELEPDEIADGIYFQPGARDGIMLFNSAFSELRDEEKEMVSQILTAITTKDLETAETSLHALFENRRMIECSDYIQEEILKNQAQIGLENLYMAAAWQVLSSTSIECVKFGLTILGMMKTDDDKRIRNIVRVLALCDEFSFFCFCIMQTWWNGEEEILNVAHKLEGWGRVHAIYFLKGEEDRTRRWLISEGAHNDVHLSYTAYECYEKGRLYERLGGFLMDAEFDGACTIVNGLLDEGPMEGISKIAESNDLFIRFFSQFKEHKATLYQYELVLNILNYLHDKEGAGEEELAIMERGVKIICSKECCNLVKKAAKKGEGTRLAEVLGFDFTEEYFSLLRSDCKKYRHLAATLMKEPNNVERVVKIFEDALDALGDISEPKYWAFDDDIITTVFCLQELKGHVGKGISLLTKASKSSVRSLRNMVLNVAEAWIELSGCPIEDIAPSLKNILEAMLKNETVEEHKLRIQGILNNQIYIPEPLEIG